VRLLYLTNGFPYPLTSGYLRHYHFIRELSARHAITLLALAGPGFEPEHLRGLEPFVEQVRAFRRAPGARSIARKLADRLGTPGPVRELRAAVTRCLAERRFDAVILSGKQTLPAIAGLELPVVIDVCDAASERMWGSLRYGPLAAAPMRALDYLRMRRMERALVRRGSHLLFASCRDREAVLGADARPATVVPNGVDLEYWRRSTCALGRDTVVFTGAMHYPPNIDAAVHLIEDVLPRLRRHRPGVQLLVVGRDPAPRLAALASRPGVTITGYVDDVRPWLDRATIFVAPLRFGAGIQNKLLEAMACQVPVIASELAADGLRTEEGELPPIEIARSADEFAECAARQLHARELSPSPDAAARKYVERHFSWRASADRIEEALRRCVP
jgi:glycosyltransferase involved in cell wall biosynthesis